MVERQVGYVIVTGGSGGFSDTGDLLPIISASESATAGDTTDLTLIQAAPESAALGDAADIAVVLPDQETMAYASETVGMLVRRWATTSSPGGGTAPSNAANGYYENDGNVATIKAGGLSNGTSSCSFNIAPPMSEVGSGTDHTFYAWFQTSPGAGNLDTFTVAVAYTQVGQSAQTTTYVLNTQSVALNYLTTPLQVRMTNVDPSKAVGIFIQHSAALPSTAGSAVFDACCIETVS